VIPWRDREGNITSLWGRLIRPLKEGEKESDKYKPFSTDATKDHLFLIHKATECQTLVLVEGYFDALRATTRSLEGVVALAGSSLTRKQLATLEPLNIKNIILALDNDDAGRKGVERSLDMLKDSKYNLFVVNLPPGVKDPDEAMRTPQGMETFKRLLAHPQSAAQWQTRHILNAYETSTPQGKRESLHKILSYEVTLKNPFDRQDCVQTYTAALDITSEDIKAIRLELQEKYECQKKQTAYETFFKEGTRLLQADQLSDTWIDEKTREIQAQTTVGSLVPYRLEDGLRDLAKSLEGLKTGYISLDQVIRIPQQAMTIVAGRPSHGKTTLLLNLFLNMIEEYPEKAFFFFSYEESKQRLFIKAINILSQVVITQKYQAQNLRQLENFLKGSYTNILQVLEGQQIYADLTTQKRLWLIDDRFYIQDLVNQLAYLKDKYDVGAVFIDYIQKVKITEKAGTRQQ
jgi:DNA primase